MDSRIIHLLFSLLILCLTASCGGTEDKANSTKAKDTTSPVVRLKTDTMSYKSDTATLIAYLAWDEARKERLPVVLVVHEWWGLNDYPRMRARQLAELGYLAMAVDMYGSGRVAETPDEARRLSSAIYQDPGLARARLEAAIAGIKSVPNADTGRIAAIGYCFGGAVVMNCARMGTPLKGVVSFHGALLGVPPIKDKVTAEFLVLHGEADKNVAEADVGKFKKQMDSAGFTYRFRSYPGATHAFTNPGATETGQKFNLPIAYNPAADSASWTEMRQFLKRVLN